MKTGVGLWLPCLSCLRPVMRSASASLVLGVLQSFFYFPLRHVAGPNSGKPYCLPLLGRYGIGRRQYWQPMILRVWNETGRTGANGLSGGS